MKAETEFVMAKQVNCDI